MHPHSSQKKKDSAINQEIFIFAANIFKQKSIVRYYFSYNPANFLKFKHS